MGMYRRLFYLNVVWILLIDAAYSSPISDIISIFYKNKLKTADDQDWKSNIARNGTKDEDSSEDLLTTIGPDDRPICAHCKRIYIPVCGTDRKPYYSPCVMTCETQARSLIPTNVTVAYHGPCLNYD